MVLWLLATLAGLAAAGLQYGTYALRPAVAPLALLRALVVAIVVAMLLGAPGGRSKPLAPDVALDASESWTRGGRTCDRWGATGAASSSGWTEACSTASSPTRAVMPA